MMINKGAYLAGLLVLMVLSSCLEEFEVEDSKYQNSLVVNGSINTNPPPYYITLKWSDNLKNVLSKPVTGATVEIVDDQGNTERLIEYRVGRYKTSATGIQGQVGRSYQLKISNFDNEIYESSFEKIHEPFHADSIYYKTEAKLDELTNENIEGLQFYTSHHFGSNDTNYYMIEVNETYKYEAEYKIYYYYDGKIREYDEPYKYYTCWKNNHINKFFTFYNHLELEKSVPLDIPIHFVSNKNKELTIRYSPNIILKTIGYKAYKYYNSIETLLSSESNLYSKQPYQINGNIVCTSDENKVALGYFSAQGLSEKRGFFNRPDIYIEDSGCELVTDEMRFLRFSSPSLYPIFLSVTNSYAIAPPNYRSCIDCRAWGGKISKPDFWVD